MKNGDWGMRRAIEEGSHLIQVPEDKNRENETRLNSEGKPHRKASVPQRDQPTNWSRSQRAEAPWSHRTDELCDLFEHLEKPL